MLENRSSRWFAVAESIARLAGVNKPELLPPDFTTVIDVAGYLTNSEVRHLPSFSLAEPKWAAWNGFSYGQSVGFCMRTFVEYVHEQV